MQRAVAINLLSDSRFPYNFVKAEKKEKMAMSYMRLWLWAWWQYLNFDGIV